MKLSPKTHCTHGNLLFCFCRLWSTPPVKNHPNAVQSETDRYISTNNLTTNNHMPGGDCPPLMWCVRSSQKRDCIPVLGFGGYFSPSTRKRREMWWDRPSMHRAGHEHCRREACCAYLLKNCTQLQLHCKYSI